MTVINGDGEIYLTMSEYESTMKDVSVRTAEMKGGCDAELASGS